MEIHHKIKPLHGWREFIGEVGIIVFGVLIALGAEQLAETIHWREKVAAGHEAISADLSELYFLTRERELISICLNRRLIFLAQFIDKAGQTGVLPPLGDIGNPPSRPWTMSSWDNMVASQTSIHFTKADFAALSGIAEEARRADALNDSEFEDWSILYTLVGPGRSLASGEEAQLRAALSRAFYKAKLMRVVAIQMRRAIKRSGHALDPDFARDWPKTWRTERTDLAKRGFCAPIPAPPPNYGQAPFHSPLDAPVRN